MDPALENPMRNTRCDLPDMVGDTERYTTELRDYFTPDQKQIYEYCLAHASVSQQQEVYAAVCLPYMVREITCDLAGTRSGFTRQYHSLLSYFIRKRPEPVDHVWANDRPNVHTIVGEDDDAKFEEAIQACVETWLGPVVDGRCNDPAEYDGFIVRATDWGKKIEVERPASASKRTILPAKVSYRPMPPPGRDDLTLEQKRDYALEKLAEALPEAQRKGREARLKNKQQQRAELDARPRCRVNFRGQAEAVKRAETEYDEWLKFYRECRDTFPVDQRVVFPAGTVRFRFLGAICDPAPITRFL